MLMVVTGGSGSGKSEYAEKAVLALQKEMEASMGERIILQYVATMIPFDAESRRRVLRHRRLREGKHFYTTECPYHLEELEIKPHSIILLECMSNLAANELYSGNRTKEECVEVIMSGVTHCMNLAESVVVVTNDVHSDGGCFTDEVQGYIRQLGKINREMAVRAQAVIEVVYGIPIVQKGEEKWKLL